MVLYPMFVHMYLELVYKGSEKEGMCSYSNCLILFSNCQLFVSDVLILNFLFKCFVAQSFFACFRGSQEDYHEEDLSKLAAITRREHMNSNELMGTLRYHIMWQSRLATVVTVVASKHEYIFKNDILQAVSSLFFKKPWGRM